MQNFFNKPWEFSGGKEDKDNFIQKALKVSTVFKVEPLKTPRPDVPSKKTAYNLFSKDIRKTKKELQGVPVYKGKGLPFPYRQEHIATIFIGGMKKS